MYCLEFLGLLDVLLYYYQDNILNNPQNKEMYIFEEEISCQKTIKSY